MPEGGRQEANGVAEWFPVGPAGDVAGVQLAPRATPPGSFAYLDCGAWRGDGEASPALRDFAILCGRTVVLCEFQGTEPVATIDGVPRAEQVAIDRALRALAGPQRTDVTVKACLRAPEPEGVAPAGEGVHVLLPELHLPVLTTLPKLHPDLVPDPSRATCACHGPIVMRILYGSAGPPAYRAVGARLSRDPNDWIFLLAQSYERAARDLMRLVDRITKHGGIHLVQLGHLFELWDGYSCAFEGAGRMAWVRPEIQRYVSEEDLVERWCRVTHDTVVRDAVLKVLRIPPAKRTLLFADYLHGPPAEPEEGLVLPPASFELPGVLFAENRPEPMSYCADDPPLAFFALLEQQTRFRAWERKLEPGWRWAMLAQASARWSALRFGLYAMAHTGRARLLAVDIAERHRGEPPLVLARDAPGGHVVPRLLEPAGVAR